MQALHYPPKWKFSFNLLPSDILLVFRECIASGFTDQGDYVTSRESTNERGEHEYPRV